MCSLLLKLTAFGLNLNVTRQLTRNPRCLLKRYGELQKVLPALHYCLQAKDNTEVAPLDEHPEPDTLYQRLRIEVRGHDGAVLKSYGWFMCKAAKELNITVGETLVPKQHKMRRTALKSAFVHKKHMIHYEFRTYFRIIELKYLTGSTADTYLEYIQRNLPEGVSMKVTKEALEVIPGYIKPPTVKE